MTTARTLSKLRQYGEVHADRGHYWVEHKGQIISFMDQGGEARNIRRRYIGDNDDPTTGDLGGRGVKNIAQALRLVGW